MSRRKGSFVRNVRTFAVSVRFAYRWFTGHCLDGEHRTDASWTRKGTKVTHSSGRALTWHYLPRWHRARYRSGGTLLAVLLGFGLIADLSVTLWALGALGVAAVATGLWWLVWWYQGYDARKACRIIANAVAAHLKTEPAAQPHQWITIEQTDTGKVVTTKLPADYHHSDRQEQSLAKLVAKHSRMKVGHDYEYVGGEHPSLVVREMETPPDLVDLAMARDALDRAGAGRYFLGFGVGCEELWIDLNDQAPHVAWSCGTGAGKTVAGRNLAAQVRREGGRVELFDFAKEGESHGDWVYDEHGELYPGIGFYEEVAAAHDALIVLGQERRRRSTLAKRARQYRTAAPVFPRILVVLEEMNTGVPELTAYWQAIRTPQDPKESPAITAYRDLVTKGRATLMNVLAVAQRFDAKVTGGGDVRSNFSVRMLARFDDQARRMLIPEITPKPTSSTHRGRAIVCTDGEAKAIQGVYLTVEETRERAFGSPDEAGRTFEPLALSTVSQTDDDACEPCLEQGENPVEIELGPDSPVVPDSAPKRPAGPLSLRDAADRRVVGATYRAMTNARQRKDPAFPEPVDRTGKTWLYAAADLKGWEAQRSADVPVEIDGSDA